jgi:hypothetical protein
MRPYNEKMIPKKYHPYNLPDKAVFSLQYSQCALIWDLSKYIQG